LGVANVSVTKQKAGTIFNVDTARTLMAARGLLMLALRGDKWAIGGIGTIWEVTAMLGSRIRGVGLGKKRAREGGALRAKVVDVGGGHDSLGMDRAEGSSSTR
jgi:hypothetical protein